MGTINISLTPEQYKELLLYAYIGEYISYGMHHPGKRKINEVNDFFQYLLSIGFTSKSEAVSQDKEYGEYAFSKEIEKQMQKRLAKYNAAIIEESIEDMMQNIMNRQNGAHLKVKK